MASVLPYPDAQTMQSFVVVPIVLFVVIHGLSEFVPLSALPFSTKNAILDKSNKYVGVMGVLIYLIAYTLFFSLLFELLAPSNIVLFVKNVLTALLYALPVVGLSYLMVRSRPIPPAAVY
jgi:hypothetical protein